MRAIHWFRSDLRLADNTALAAACRQAEALAPVFVLDDALLDRHRVAHPRLRFLRECIEDLAAALEAAGSRLVLLRGAPDRCLPALAWACNASLTLAHACRREIRGGGSESQDVVEVGVKLGSCGVRVFGYWRKQARPGLSVTRRP